MEELNYFLETINNLIKTEKIYDIENPDHYISGVEYDPYEDKIFVMFEEDKDGK